MSSLKSKCSIPNSSPKVGSGSVGDSGALEMVLGAELGVETTFDLVKPFKDPMDFIDLTFLPMVVFSVGVCGELDPALHMPKKPFDDFRLPNFDEEGSTAWQSCLYEVNESVRCLGPRVVELANRPSKSARSSYSLKVPELELLRLIGPCLSN